MNTFFKLAAALLFAHALVPHVRAEPQDIAFKAEADGTEQRYVELLPPNFDAGQIHDVVIALHGHGSDRWQFIRHPRDECRGVRDAAREANAILLSPDYRAKTSWMGPKAEADVRQIIAEARRRHRVGRVFIAGASMGGTGALVFTALHPGLVAGVCSLNGTANLILPGKFDDAIAASYGGTRTEVPDEYRRRSPEFWPERFTMSVALATGGRDDTVPPESVQRLGRILTHMGKTVLSIHRETGGHATTYDDTRTAMAFMFREAKR